MSDVRRAEVVAEGPPGGLGYRVTVVLPKRPCTLDRRSIRINLGFGPKVAPTLPVGLDMDL